MPYSNAFLEGSDLVVSHLLPNGHIHIGHIAEEIDDSSAGRSQLSLGVDYWHQETGKKLRFICFMTYSTRHKFLKTQWDMQQNH